MNLKLISWNVQGLNNKDKRAQIKNALKLWNGEIICFQETKMEHIG
jgi:exonuclease III